MFMCTTLYTPQPQLQHVTLLHIYTYISWFHIHTDLSLQITVSHICLCVWLSMHRLSMHHSRSGNTSPSYTPRLLRAEPNDAEVCQKRPVHVKIDLYIHTYIYTPRLLHAQLDDTEVCQKRHTCDVKKKNSSGKRPINMCTPIYTRCVFSAQSPVILKYVNGDLYIWCQKKPIGVKIDLYIHAYIYTPRLFRAEPGDSEICPWRPVHLMWKETYRCVNRPIYPHIYTRLLS